MNNFITFFFIAIGIIGVILFVFSLQFNGTLCGEIQKAGMTGIGIFAAWNVFNLVETYIKQRDLENL